MDRIIEKKRFTLKRITGIAVGALIIVFLGYQLFLRSKESRLKVQMDRLTISTVTKGPFREFIPITGTIIPIKTIFLDAIEGGRVTEIFLESGNFVTKDEKILTLENTNLLLDIMFREAEFVQQQNFLRNTRLQMEQNNLQLRREIIDNNFQIQRLKREYDRKAELYSSNVISQQEYEQAKDEYEYYIQRKSLAVEKFKTDSMMRQVQILQLENSLTRMQRNLEFVKKNQENLILKAPISGQLTSFNVEIGQSIQRGERLGQIDVLDGFKVRADIDEYHITRINTGQTGTFPLAGREGRLIISKVYPEVGNNRFKVDLNFMGNEPLGIRRGQTLHIRLALSDLSEAVLLPSGGFFQTTGGNWVYILDESGATATKRFIKLGKKNPLMYEVLEGLQPGEKVITSPYENFGNNDILILIR